MNRYRLLRLLAIVALAMAGLPGTVMPVIHAAPPSQDTDAATLHIVNDSEQTICYVLICPPRRSRRR